MNEELLAMPRMTRKRLESDLFSPIQTAVSVWIALYI